MQISREQALADGWPEDEVDEYLAGRDRAGASLAAIVLPERDGRVGQELAPLGETERRAAGLAEQLVAMSDAKDAGVRAERIASAREAAVALIDRPGDGPTVEQQREWALVEARRRYPVVMRPGAANEQRDYCLPLGDGRTLLTRQSEAPVIELTRPEQWEQRDREYRQRERDHQNELLIRAFGEQRCRASGIIP